MGCRFPSQARAWIYYVLIQTFLIVWRRSATCVHISAAASLQRPLEDPESAEVLLGSETDTDPDPPWEHCDILSCAAAVHPSVNANNQFSQQTKTCFLNIRWSFWTFIWLKCGHIYWEEDVLFVSPLLLTTLTVSCMMHDQAWRMIFKLHEV